MLCTFCLSTPVTAHMASTVELPNAAFSLEDKTDTSTPPRVIAELITTTAGVGTAVSAKLGCMDGMRVDGDTVGGFVSPASVGRVVDGATLGTAVDGMAVEGEGLGRFVGEMVGSLVGRTDGDMVGARLGAIVGPIGAVVGTALGERLGLIDGLALGAMDGSTVGD